MVRTLKKSLLLAPAEIEAHRLTHSPQDEVRWLATELLRSLYIEAAERGMAVSGVSLTAATESPDGRWREASADTVVDHLREGRRARITAACAIERTRRL